MLIDDDDFGHNGCTEHVDGSSPSGTFAAVPKETGEGEVEEQMRGYEASQLFICQSQTSVFAVVF